MKARDQRANRVLAILYMLFVCVFTRTGDASEPVDRTELQPGGVLDHGFYTSQEHKPENTAFGVRDKFFSINQLDDHYFVSVGAQGLVVRTSSRGAAQIVSIGTEINLFSVIKTKDNKIWIGGENGQMFYGDSTLQSWTPVSLGSKENILDIIERADKSLIVVGSYGLLMTGDTLNGSWRQMDIPWSLYLKDAWAELGEAFPHLYSTCTDESGDLVVVGEFGLVLEQVSGRWLKRHGGSIESAIFDCAMSDDGQSIMAVGQKGLILQSLDSGLTWSESTAAIETDLYRVEYFDQVFMAVGDGKKILVWRSKQNPVCMRFASDTSLGWYIDTLITDTDIVFVGSAGSIKNTTRNSIVSAMDNFAGSREFVACE